MRKALLLVPKPFTNETVFDSKSKYNSDGLMESLISLKKQFAEAGIELIANDRIDSEKYEFHLYSNIPAKNVKQIDSSKSYLILLETDLIMPWNWDLENHKKFKKIFTWNDEIIDNKRYFKYNSGRAGVTEWKSYDERSKLCTLISGNKSVNHPLELYSLRKEYIEYFENGKEEYFDFYGQGWDKYYFKGPKVVRALNRITSLQKAMAPRYKTYKGVVARKIDVLRNYKFSICFENGRDLPNGHISEKIFDSMAAGCVPIYWGAHNITDYVPEGCFVDYRKFSSKDDIFNFMKDMPKARFEEYLESMRSYMSSRSYFQFTPEHNARTIVAEILKDLG